MGLDGWKHVGLSCALEMFVDVRGSATIIEIAR